MTDVETPAGERPRVTGYVDVHAQARNLGLTEVEGAAILPRNFATAGSRSDLSHESSASTMRKLLAQEGLHVTQVQPADGGRLPLTLEFDDQSIIPLVVFCAECFSVAGLVGTVVRALLSWAGSRTKIRFRCVVQRASDASFVHLDWSGPPACAPDVEAVIQELHHGTREPREAGRSGEQGNDYDLPDDGQRAARERET